MRRSLRRRACLATAAALVALDGSAGAATLQRAERLPAPVDMQTLHATGGVPPGWQLQIPPGDAAAGREAFARLGCGQCHAAEPTGPSPSAPGPDLRGMGSHHSAAYFAESIVNPDAVLVSGPGYLGADGRSVMPVYPEMTLAELADLTAYLASLTDASGAHLDAAAPSPAGAPVFADLPPPPPSDAGYFLAQSYSVAEGQLASFERWFADEGAGALLRTDGLLGVETFVDRTRGASGFLTVFAFRDRAALERFYTEKTSTSAAQRFDAFAGAHGHLLFTSAPIYRVDALSAGAELACRPPPRTSPASP